MILERFLLELGVDFLTSFFRRFFGGCIVAGRLFFGMAETASICILSEAAATADGSGMGVIDTGETGSESFPFRFRDRN